MLAVHQVLAVGVIVAAGVAAVWGGIAWRRRREPGPVLLHTITLVQTLLIGQVAVGLLLLSDDRRAAEKLHYLYGTLALAAVLAPWVYAPSSPRSRLGWFAGASLLAALLAIRAYTTAG